MDWKPIIGWENCRTLSAPASPPQFMAAGALLDHHTLGLEHAVQQQVAVAQVLCDRILQALSPHLASLRLGFMAVSGSTQALGLVHLQSRVLGQVSCKTGPSRSATFQTHCPPFSGKLIQQLVKLLPFDYSRDFGVAVVIGVNLVEPMRGRADVVKIRLR